MECNKWEETGLLYVSRELNEDQRADFKNHLSICSYCSNEHSLYTLEKTRFFSPDVLSIQTTPELDNKIIGRCLAVVPTQAGIMGTLWIKRIVFSALVFAFGAGAGGYFTFAYYHAKSGAAIAAANAKAMNAPVASSAAPSIATERNSSSLSVDSSKPGSIPDLRAARASSEASDKSGRSPSVNKGTGTSHGIITVDLKKE
jgi:hypothetical protein